MSRVLLASVRYPVDYGFIPNTCGGDGDPLDVLVLVEEPTFPGCHIVVRPVGILLMRDEKGRDEKVLAVPTADPRFDRIRNLKDVPQYRLDEIENFFAIYKDLEGVGSQVQGWGTADRARQLIRKYQSRQ